MTDITFYNMWRTETPEGRAALLARMKAEAPAIASKAGFVAMTVLECAEDGRVLVEGRWQSKEAFDTAVADDPEAQKARASLAQFGSPEPGLFTEVSVFRQWRPPSTHTRDRRVPFLHQEKLFCLPESKRTRLRLMDRKSTS
jgi:heme-degrading monooxygenase HmoA